VGQEKTLIIERFRKSAGEMPIVLLSLPAAAGEDFRS
jgi:hypothetical protein